MSPNTLSDFLFALEQVAQPLWFWIVQGAVFTTATALLIIIFKLIFKNRISAKWHFLVWGILLIRLVFPVLPSTPVSIFNFAKMDEQSVTSSSVVNIVSQEGYYRQSDEPRYSVTFGENAVPDNKADDDGGVYYNTNVHAFRFGEFFAMILAAEALLLSVYFIIVLVIYRRGLKKKRRVCDEKALSVFNSCKEKLGIKRTVRLYFADTTPVLTGLFRPSIYIPDSYSEHELEAVLIHELCHLKHLDVLWSGVAAAILCLNWYNPVIWVSFFMFKRDIELYCDERTLKFTGNKQSYAKLLLKTVAKNRYVLGTSSLQSGKSDVKRRIKFLAKYKKITAVAVIAVILAAAISVICLTNATEKQSGASSEHNFKYEVIRNRVVKYDGEKEVWSTVFFEDSEATPEQHGAELEYVNTSGNDKVKLFFGGAHSSSYRVDEQDQDIGFITAVNAENGNVLFSKEFSEFAHNENKDEDTFYRGFVSAAAVRKDGNIDAFIVQMTHTDGFEPGYETTLVTLNQKGETIRQSKFNTGEIRYFDSVCETDDGYAVCGYNREHNPDYVIAKAVNNNVRSQITIKSHVEQPDNNYKTWNFTNPHIWSIGGKTYLTINKEDITLLGKYVAYDSTNQIDYANVLQDEKDGNFAVLYTVDFENETAKPYDIPQCISGNRLFTDESGNICYRVIKITAKSAQFIPLYGEPIENAEYWIYVFDRDGNPVENFSTKIPAKTDLPFEVLD